LAGLPWVVTIYTLMFSALQLSADTLSDRVGVHQAYGAGLVLFLLVSAACGLAPTLPVLIGLPASGRCRPSTAAYGSAPAPYQRPFCSCRRDALTRLTTLGALASRSEALSVHALAGRTRGASVALRPPRLDQAAWSGVG